MDRCPFLDLCKYAVDKIGVFYLQLIIIVIAMIFGTLLIWRPKKVIEIQISLYRPFNWRIEPISMEKEIRNTRIMGAVVSTLAMASLVYVIIIYLK